MIIDVSNSGLNKIFQNKELYLPKRWNGTDFLAEIRQLFDVYINQLKFAPNTFSTVYSSITLRMIRNVSQLVLWTIKDYLDGYPEKAYLTFTKLMDILIQHPFEDTILENSKPITLYRAAKEKTNKSRERMFHTPYHMRSKVPTCRYSIAGFPCLYLSTSLDICCYEIGELPKDSILAAAFRVNEPKLIVNKIRVYDLSVKPQDIIRLNNEDSYANQIPPSDKYEFERRNAYLLWYPVIAACSFIRAFPSATFAAEYIIPQLFMQWVRKQRPIFTTHEITGIRYFSCASIRASNMGYNYVFPTSGKAYSTEDGFCEYLINAFSLTTPVLVHDYNSKKECEDHLNKELFEKIGSHSKTIQ